MIEFDSPAIWTTLDGLEPAALDALGFGVVAMAPGGEVLAYNRWESRLSGMEPARVIGRRFFDQVAPCTNNDLVAERYTEEALDETIDYVFTVRIKPTPVRLRLIRQPEAERWYLLVSRR